MTREEFIKKIKVPADTISGVPINYNVVQSSVAESFDKKENFLLLSPRQSGRSTAIILNLLYDLFTVSCWDNTIVATRTINDSLNILARIKEILKLNPFINNINVRKNMIDNGTQKIYFKTAQSVQRISSDIKTSLFSRVGTRLVLFDAAFIPDSASFVTMFNGWSNIIMETVPGPNTFNSLFIKNLVTFKGAKSFKVIKYDWKECGFDEKWFNFQKEIFGDLTDKFKQEILLEWD